jgi:tetratricopeptide (TPR) repeat protein
MRVAEAEGVRGREDPGAAASRKRRRIGLALGWALILALALGVRLWNALAGPRMWGYDAWGHVAYALFLDVYRGLPWADQGWSYFHPPLHYAVGWALARFGQAELLMRGLALFGSAASLGTAGLTALLVRCASPGRPELALVAFAGVACLPVHLFASPMPGNAMTLALLASAALCVFVANESRTHPALLGDAAGGALVGLALLAHFGGLIPGLAMCAALFARAPCARPRGPALRRAALRAAVLAAAALVLAGPYYARNLNAFGNPFEMSRSYPLVAVVESEQRPGARSWRDYVSVSPRLFADPDPRAAHMLHSVWGTLYAGVWADIFRESDEERALRVPAAAGWLAAIGLAPTAIAFLGSWLALGDVRRGRRRAVYLVLLFQTLASLIAFGVFAWCVPIWSALKSTYLLGLSPAWGAFLARGVEGLAAREGRGWRLAPLLALAGVAVATSVANLSGVGLPRRADAPATGAVYFYFGDYAGARRVYARLAEGAHYAVPWLDNLAAVELAQGRASQARRLYARAVALERTRGFAHDYRRGQLAVATALDGEPAAGRALLDEVLADADLLELRANRAVMRALDGDTSGAADDLRAALASRPDLVPGWLTLAALHERSGHADLARSARARAAREACAVSRAYPYGIGDGEVLEWGVGRRWLLWIDEAWRPALASPGFYREACRGLEVHR